MDTFKKVYNDYIKQIIETIITDFNGKIVGSEEMIFETIMNKLSINPDNIKSDISIKNNIKITDYSELSKQLTCNLSKEIKKTEGIFFSPPESIKKMINYIDKIEGSKIGHNIKDILEPSYGSGEIINYLEKYYDNTKELPLNITGIEKNNDIYNTTQILKEGCNNVNLINEDFLLFSNDKKFDLIIGNPPYFVMKKNGIPKEYKNYMKGRPNIFTIFILKSLDLLKNNGILAFILPKSFMNCSYYSSVREFIFENFNIKTIIECFDDKYIETEQETIILILKKQKVELNAEYCINNNYYLFNTKDNILRMKEIMNSSTTLNEMGFSVFNGNFVWNQEKNKLTNNSNNVRLIYSGDIKNNKVQELDMDEIKEKWNDLTNKYENEPNKSLKNKIDKKHYVFGHDPEPLRGLMLVINRGYGNASYKLNYALIDSLDKYYLENHVLGIKYNGKISKEDLIIKYNNIILSLNNKKTHDFISMCMGNNAMNTTELEYLLPIFN